MANEKAKQTQAQLVGETLSNQHRAVSNYLSKLKFSKRAFGVDEADVWRKMEKLCELYEDAIDAERARADEAQRKLDAIYARARELKAARKPVADTLSQEVGNG